MNVSSKAQLVNAVETKLGFKVVETRYFPQYRNTTMPCWDIEVEYAGTVYFVEGDTVQELYDNIIEELL